MKATVTKIGLTAVLLAAASMAQGQTIGQEAQTVPTPPAGGSVDYWASYWSSDWSSHQETNSSADSSTRTGNIDAGSVFEAGSVVSSANLASNVSGVSVIVGSETGNSSVSNGLTLGASAFQGFAGVQAMNMNTGAAASQNASVNVNTPGR